MRGIAARAYAAEMVKIETLGYWPVRPFPVDSMGVERLAVDPQTPISLD